MIIKKIAFGNAEEAFLEDRLQHGFNIIFSDDNNKGKTIVMQSALYAIGNEPIFPSSFNYRDFFHYVEIELDGGRTVISCRKKNSFIVKTENGLSILDTVSELKRFLTRSGFNFPFIVKDNALKMVDPVLLYQIFFVGQDKKDSSSIFNDNYYKKDDFWNLIFALAGVGNTDVIEFETDDINKRISLLAEEKKLLLEQNKFLKKTTPALELISQKQGNDAFEDKVGKVNVLRNSIIELKKAQNRALLRRTINERTLSEIRALNRVPPTGDLYCLECGSKRIGYSSADRSYTFDISDAEMRRNIYEAIEDKINTYQEEIDRYTVEINGLQRQMQEFLKEESISLESVLMYRNEIIAASDADTRVAEIDREIKALKSQRKSKKLRTKEDQIKRDKLRKDVIDTMNLFYKTVDSSGTLVFNDLFSKRSSVYSGCEATEFYLAKLYSLAVTIDHRYPIMMDYFRDGELSTDKEEVVLGMFGKLPNQIIFTATLKEQELGKYAFQERINAIDYSNNKASHILSPLHVAEFKRLLKPLMINLESDRD